VPTKFDVEILQAAIEGFEARKQRLDAQIAEIRQQLTGASAKPAGAPEPQPTRRKVSAAGRKRMAEAQRKRWATAKRQNGVAAQSSKVAPPKAKRQISEEGMQRIIAATKKRWAAVRAAAAKAAK
jgi:hypothetical protein